MSLVASIVVSLVLAAVSLVLSELLRPKPDIQDAKPAGKGDFQFPTAIEGRVIPLIFGTNKLSGPNVVWWGDLQAEAIRETIKTGLWSSKRITKGYTYRAGIQMALCLGQVDEVSRIWVGEKLAASGSVQDGTYTLNDPKFFGGDDFGNGGLTGTVRVHSGSPTQAANSYLDSFQNPNIPLRNTCYVVAENVNLGNSTTIKPWSFEVKRFPNGLGLTSNRHIVNSSDANPAAVLYELLTNTDWGFGLPASDVDASNFQSVGNTLHSEGNGFSMIIDRKIEAVELLTLIQEQIDGLVYLDQEDGLFKVSLARDDYDIDLVPQLSESTGVIEVKEFTRGTWEETSNQVRIEFTDRDRDYFDTFSQSHDLGNQAIQGGEIVSATVTMPGVKDKTLANKLADRELRQLAIPLAKGTITVDRRYWNTKPNDVLAWTDDNLGFSKLPVRIVKIDYGNLTDGRITLSVVQDVFKITTAFFGEPESTLWTPPTQDVGDLPDALVFEAPRAIVKRDPTDPSNLDRVWAGARRDTGGEVTFSIWQRNASGTPSGDYLEDSDPIPLFFLVGELRTALSPGAADGSATVQIDPDPDSIADMLDLFTASPSGSDIGSNLVNLCYIDTPGGGEFIAPTSLVNQTTHIDLQNTWRGLLDTVPGTHSAGVKVYLMFAGGDLNVSAIEQGHNVDVQLRADSFTDATTEGEATTHSLTMNRRAVRPYPATQLQVNETLYDTAPDVDDQQPSTSGLDNRGLYFAWIRRDFETYIETQGITTDAASIDGNFPNKHTTRYRFRATVPSDSLLTSLEAFWRMEEATSADRLDETANDNDLRDNAGVANATGHIGDAASFSGGPYLELDGSGQLDFGDESWTIAGWFLLDDKTTSYCFVSKWNANSGDQQYVMQYAVGSNRIQFAGSDDGTTNSFSVLSDNFGSPPSSTYFFVAFGYDHVNDEAFLKINNSPKNTASHAGGLFQGSAKFRMGNFIGSGGGNVNQLKGDIDAVGVWSRVLTDQELGMLYNAGNGQEHDFSGGAELADTGFVLGASDHFLSRTSILFDQALALPDTIDVEVDVDHDVDGTARTALQKLTLQLSPVTGTLGNDTKLGALDANQVSTVYTAPDTGTYDFEIGTALSTGDVEARINGGAWSTVISSGNTTGTLAGVTAADTIEVRHTELSVSGETFLQVDAPTSTAGAWGILF